MFSDFATHWIIHSLETHNTVFKIYGFIQSIKHILIKPITRRKTCQKKNISINLHFRELSMRRIIYATNCPCDESSMQRIVHATNCPCDELSMRRIVHATNCPRRIVRATNCPRRIVRDELSVRRIVRAPSADGSSSTYEEMDLFNGVKQELAHSYLKTSVNNENKYLRYVNKQHAGFYRIACKSLCHDF